MTYNAISDTNYYPKPELPKLGPAGTIIVDPTFGCQILRLTDEKSAGGLSVVTNASAEMNTWNTDSTLLTVQAMSMQAFFYHFDPKTMKATPVEGAPSGSCLFSRHDPNIGWFNGGKGVVYTYDFATGKKTDVLNVAKVTGMDVPRTGQFDVSANDTIVVVFGGKMQDLDNYVLVYNTKDGSHHLWDTAKGTLDGKQLPADSPRFLMHSISIDMSGRYVLAALSGAAVKDRPEEAKPKGAPVFLDIQTGQVYVMTARTGGHHVMGYGDMINDVHVWDIRDLDAAKIDQPKDLVQHPKGEAYFMYDTHPSWNNARPGMMPPLATSSYHDNSGTDPKCAWGDEVVAAATDGSGKVWRFAHTRTLVTNPSRKDYNFWDTPRGNISQDGRFFMFTSNWEGTLGKEKDGHSRRDVFIVRLDREAK